MTTSAGLRPVIDRPLKREQIEFTLELRAELRATLVASFGMKCRIETESRMC